MREVNHFLQYLKLFMKTVIKIHSTVKSYCQHKWIESIVNRGKIKANENRKKNLNENEQRIV